jgi:hypothetical protein
VTGWRSRERLALSANHLAATLFPAALRRLYVFPGTGIQGNLADKAKKLGIPIWKFGNSGA